MLNNIKTYLAINILSCYIKTISRYTRTIIKLISKFRQKYGTLVKPVTKVVFPVVSSIHNIVASSTISHYFSYKYFSFLAMSFAFALGCRIHFIWIKNRLIFLLAYNNVISLLTCHFRIHTRCLYARRTNMNRFFTK